MEMETIIQLVTNGLFPIAMCLMLFWYIKDEQKKTQDILNNLDKSIVSLKDTIDYLIGKANKSIDADDVR